MQITSEFWLIRHPDPSGAVIARFRDHCPRPAPDTIVEYDDFIIETVPDRATLQATTLDQSGLTDSEKQRLSKVFPIIEEQTGGPT
jgi:hypothetical protein